MNTEADNLVLEHLRHIRSRVDQNAEDMKEVKQRLTALERGQAKLIGEDANLHESDARQQGTIDRIVERLERIERRLELSE